MLSIKAWKSLWGRRNDASVEAPKLLAVVVKRLPVTVYGKIAF